MFLHKRDMDQTRLHRQNNGQMAKVIFIPPETSLGGGGGININHPLGIQNIRWATLNEYTFS